MKEIATRNAIIKNASLGIEDHGFLSSWLSLDYGGSGQGFGGYVLSSCGKNSENLGDYCGLFIKRVLQIAGVNKWDELKGKTIRVKCDYEHIEAIGHIINDDWFNPSEEFEKIRSKADFTAVSTDLVQRHVPNVTNDDELKRYRINVLEEEHEIYERFVEAKRHQIDDSLEMLEKTLDYVQGINEMKRGTQAKAVEVE